MNNIGLLTTASNGNGLEKSEEKKAETKEMEVSRREFLRASGVGVSGIFLLGALNPGRTLARPSAEKAILCDSTLCIDCHACEIACKRYNKLEEDITTDDLSPNTWLKIESRQVEMGGESIWLFTRRACMHCATCVNVCPTGAISERIEDGIVVVDHDKCIGCHYCFFACPFDIPRYGEDGTMQKCDFCSDRLELGKEPACVEACPVDDALIYGDRDKLVVKGRERVQALRAEGYSNAYLYGDKELGGLPVMYVLAHSPEVYGLTVTPKVPVAATAWQDILRPLGWILGGLAILGVGLSYIIAKKAKLTRELPSEREE